MVVMRNIAYEKYHLLKQKQRTKWKSHYYGTISMNACCFNSMNTSFQVQHLSIYKYKLLLIERTFSKVELIKRHHERYEDR